MDYSSNVFADAGHRTYWPMARAAHVDLHLMSRQGLNVLLTGTNVVVQDTLARLMPTLRTPIQTWTPREPLVLPPPTQTGTLILREVGALSAGDQVRLLKWLEVSGGRTQVISTSRSLVLPLVESCLFHDTLYYRLNVACVDLTE